MCIAFRQLRRTSIYLLLLALLLILPAQKSVFAQTFGIEDNCTQFKIVGTPEQVTFDPANDTEPCWSPDGNFIAFASDRTGNQEIYIINLATGTIDTVTRNGNRNWHPDWSNCNLISFTGGSNSDQIWVISPDGSGESAITTSGPHRHQDWSPDGSKFAYTAALGTEGPIEIINSDGSGSPSTVVSSGWYPDWSPNSSRIVFARYYGGGQIYLVDPDGGNLKNISTSNDYHACPAWSPDGSVIACSITKNGNSEIYIIDTLGNEIMQVTNSPLSDDINPAWSPTGNSIGFQSNRTGNADIWIVSFVSEITFPFISTNPCDSCDLDYGQQPVTCDLSQPAVGASVPFKIPDNVEICGISYEGLITEDWEYNLEVINEDSGYVQVVLANSHGEIIPEDTTTLFFIQFVSPRLCNENYYIHWDTALSEDTLRSLRFTDTLYNTFYPFTDYYRDSTEIQGYIPGDADNSGGEPDISDITRIIDFLYLSHTGLCCLEAADPNGDCKIDISDITILIGYLYLHSVAELRCGCSEAGLAAYKPALPGNSVVSEYNGGWTYITLSGSEDYTGLHIELSGSGADIPEKLLPDGIEMIYGMDGNSINIGLFDMEGLETVANGTQPLLKLEGEYEIIKAVASTKTYQSVELAINPSTKENILPTDFTLYQNFPNPFNPITEICFDLPSACDVKLEIFNITGQKVTTLIDRGLEAGHHTVRWDANNNASGIYLYRITADDIIETRKMVLLK